jgi:hypothetical protein
MNPKLASDIEELVATAVSGQVKLLRDTIADKMKSVANTGLMYKGIWSDEREYVTNEAVTQNGGMWIALRDNQGIKPGLPENKADPYWKLIVKRADRMPSPKLSIDREGTMTATSEDGSTYIVGSVKELIRDLLVEHGVIPSPEAR